MSWMSSFLGDAYKKGLEYTPIYGVHKAFGAKNAYTDFMESEMAKSELRGAEATTFLKGLPYVGGVVSGIDGINELEDLYNNTGKVPAYPGASSPGAQGLASAATGIARKIEDGVNDLGTYYSGDVNLNSQFENQAPVKHGDNYTSLLKAWE